MFQKQKGSINHLKCLYISALRYRLIMRQFYPNFLYCSFNDISSFSVTGNAQGHKDNKIDQSLCIEITFHASV